MIHLILIFIGISIGFIVAMFINDIKHFNQIQTEMEYIEEAKNSDEIKSEQSILESPKLTNKFLNKFKKVLQSNKFENVRLKENELYQEIEIFDGEDKIGEAEVDIKNKELSRLAIFEPYQNKGYGTYIVKLFNEKYGCKTLWVNTDNKRAIHVYTKNGYKLQEPSMYKMTKE